MIHFCMADCPNSHSGICVPSFILTDPILIQLAVFRYRCRTGLAHLCQLNRHRASAQIPIRSLLLLLLQVI